MDALGTRLLGARGYSKAFAKQGMSGIEDGHILIVDAP
jgi:hypothetical protein